MGARRIPAIRIPEDRALLGYIAGIVDGEGCISICPVFDKQKSVSTSHALKVIVVNTDRDLITWLVDSVGGSMCGRHVQKATWRVPYTWTVGGQNAADLLRAIRPWLRIKAAQADVGLALRDLPRHQWRGRALDPELVEQRGALYMQMRVLNARGCPETISN